MTLTKMLISLTVATACGSVIAADETQTTPAPTPPSNVQVTPYQKAIIDSLVYSVLVSKIEQGQSNPLSETYPGITVSDPKKLSDAYSGNEFKADKTFKGKWVLLQGGIKDIRKSSSGPTARLTPIGEEYPTVNIAFDETPGIEKVMEELDPGDKVAVICEGAGKEILPELKKCVFYSSALSPAIVAFQDKLVEAVEGKGDKAENAPIAYGVLALQEELGPDKEKICEKGVVDCMLAGEAINKNLDEMPIPQSYLDLGYTPEMLGINKATTNTK